MKVFYVISHLPRRHLELLINDRKDRLVLIHPEKPISNGAHLTDNIRDVILNRTMHFVHSFYCILQ